MHPTELKRVIGAISRDRGIGKDLIVSALEEAVLATAQKRLGPGALLEAHYNDQTGEIELYQFKKVPEDLSLDEARKLDPAVLPGDELGMRIDSSEFGRIDAQTAKQVIFQKVREAEDQVIFHEYLPLKGELISGIVRREEGGNCVVDLGRAYASLPRRELIPGERLRAGDRIEALLSDVALTSHGARIYLSRSSTDFVIRLLQREVPEIKQGVVEVRACVREPGRRSKVAVLSNDPMVDPVGACVGPRGARIQRISQDLEGEKIDIFEWSDDFPTLVRSALAPAEISDIRFKEDVHSMEVVVEDSQFPVALGRNGQNVRLASRMLGWDLRIIAKSEERKLAGKAA